MASTDARPQPIRSVAYRISFPILDGYGNPTNSPSSLSPKISKNAAAAASTTNTAVQIPGLTGRYYLDLSAIEMDADLVDVQLQQTGGKYTDITLFPISSKDHLTNLCFIGQATAGTTTSATLPASASAAANFYNGGMIRCIAGTGVGQPGRMITGYTSGRVASWSSSNPLATAFDATSVLVVTDVPGFVAADTPTNFSSLDIGADGKAKANVGAWLGSSPLTPNVAGVPRIDVDRWRGSVVNALIAGQVDSAASVSGNVTVSSILANAIDAQSMAPDASQEILNALLVGGIAKDLSVVSVLNQVSSVPRIGGRMDVHVGTIGAGTITNSILATDSITSTQVSAGAISEIQAGLATMNSVFTVAQLNATADHVHRRQSANIEAASGPDALSARSSYGVIARMAHRRVRAGNTVLYQRSDDSTSLTIDVITTSTALNPIASVDPP